MRVRGRTKSPGLDTRQATRRWFQTGERVHRTALTSVSGFHSQMPDSSLRRNRIGPLSTRSRQDAVANILRTLEATGYVARCTVHGLGERPFPARWRCHPTVRALADDPAVLSSLPAGRGHRHPGTCGGYRDHCPVTRNPSRFARRQSQSRWSPVPDRIAIANRPGLYH
jgi:hypothetical protein